MNLYFYLTFLLGPNQHYRVQASSAKSPDTTLLVYHIFLQKSRGFFNQNIPNNPDNYFG